jgi:hypothetical protein
MSLFKNIFLFTLIFTVAPSIFAETELENITSTESEKKKTCVSIGVNDLPWDATGVSLRWWRESGSGRELNVTKSNLSGRYRRVERIEEDSLESGIEKIREKYISLPVITYYFLNRKALGAENMYLVKGIGFGLGFSASHQDSYIPENDITEKDKRYSGTVKISFPVGVEHFFLEKFPNISYSLNADIHGTFSINYRKEMIEYPDSYPIEARTITDWYISPSFGISPAFYLRIYF